MNFKPHTFNNGNTIEQLLVKSRYLLYKASSICTENQYQRSNILFKEYIYQKHLALFKDFETYLLQSPQ
jgi:hypothetical protein